MLIVVADTSPLRYLVQFDQIQLLPRLLEKILIPSVVSDELRRLRTRGGAKLDEQEARLARSIRSGPD